MRSLEIRAFAKINLGINVLQKLENGYHRVDMVMHAISLCDNIEIDVEPQEETHITLKLAVEGDETIPLGAENLAYKAADAILKRTSKKADVRISLTKKIPSAAGLAGGSSDAAAVLLGLNKLLDMKLTLDAIAEIGTQIGADVAFCVYANALGNEAIFAQLCDKDRKRASFCMRAQGIGEVLTPLKSMGSRALLFKSDLEVSTKEVYQGLDDMDIRNLEIPDINGLVSAIQRGDANGIACNAGNVLEAYTLKKYPQIDELKHVIAKVLEPELVLMSGSGPTIFALCEQDAQISLDFENTKLFDVHLMKGGD